MEMLAKVMTLSGQGQRVLVGSSLWRLSHTGWPKHLNGEKDIDKYPRKWEREREYSPIISTWASKGRVLNDGRVIKVLLFKEIYSDAKIHCSWEWGWKGPGEALWVALGTLERPSEEVSSLTSVATWTQKGLEEGEAVQAPRTVLCPPERIA